VEIILKNYDGFIKKLSLGYVLGPNIVIEEQRRRLDEIEDRI